MQARELLDNKTAPVTIHQEKPMEYAMRLLTENKIGSLVIIDDNDKPVGIITEHDIMKLAYRFRGDMMDIRVGDHMTGRIQTARPDTDIKDIAKTMIERRFRHMPIIDENENLCGIISIRDIMKASLKAALLP